MFIGICILSIASLISASPVPQNVGGMSDFIMDEICIISAEWHREEEQCQKWYAKKGYTEYLVDGSSTSSISEDAPPYSDPFFDLLNEDDNELPLVDDQLEDIHETVVEVEEEMQENGDTEFFVTVSRIDVLVNGLDEGVAEREAFVQMEFRLDGEIVSCNGQALPFGLSSLQFEIGSLLLSTSDAPEDLEELLDIGLAKVEFEVSIDEFKDVDENIVRRITIQERFIEIDGLEITSSVLTQHLIDILPDGKPVSFITDEEDAKLQLNELYRGEQWNNLEAQLQQWYFDLSPAVQFLMALLYVFAGMNLLYLVSFVFNRSYRFYLVANQQSDFMKANDDTVVVKSKTFMDKFYMRGSKNAYSTVHVAEI